MSTTTAQAIALNAGHLIDRHAMVWTRDLQVSIDNLWTLVSTKEGLQKWWIVPPQAFELAQGGRFDHHWSNTVVGFQAPDYIDFSENTGSYRGTGGMRFELHSLRADMTKFVFLDTWGPDMRPEGEGAACTQPGGPGTPWAGVAAGWHSMLDRLQAVVEGTSAPQDIEELTAYYTAYLQQWFRFNDRVQRSSDGRVADK